MDAKRSLAVRQASGCGVRSNRRLDSLAEVMLSRKGSEGDRRDSVVDDGDNVVSVTTNQESHRRLAAEYKMKPKKRDEEREKQQKTTKLMLTVGLRCCVTLHDPEDHPFCCGKTVVRAPPSPASGGVDPVILAQATGGTTVQARTSTVDHCNV